MSSGIDRPAGVTAALLLTVGLAALPAPSAAADPWQAKLRKVEAALRAENWQRAYHAAHRLVADLCDAVSHHRAPQEPLGSAAAYLALAEAGLGRVDDARWHWRTARQLFPEVRRFDLGPHPAAAAVLAAPAEPAPGEPAPVDLDRGPRPGVVPPQRLDPDGPVVQLTRGLRRSRLLVNVRAQVGADGVLREPSLLSAGDPAVLFVALDVIRQWRYRPATAGGTPVAAYLTVVLDYQTSGPAQRLEMEFVDQPP